MVNEKMQFWHFIYRRYVTSALFTFFEIKESFQILSMLTKESQTLQGKYAFTQNRNTQKENTVCIRNFGMEQLFEMSRKNDRNSA